MKGSGSYKQERGEVEEEGQGVQRVSFRSGIKAQYEILESEVIRNNIKHPRILTDWGKRKV